MDYLLESEMVKVEKMFWYYSICSNIVAPMSWLRQGSMIVGSSVHNQIWNESGETLVCNCYILQIVLFEESEEY